MNNKLKILITAYIFLAIAIYLAFTIYKLYESPLVLSLILPLLLIAAAYIIVNVKPITPITQKGKVIRYTMHCLKCNWEWMSNTTEKAPNQCPNCHEKEKLEILGWRRVNLTKQKKDIDLRRFFR